MSEVSFVRRSLPVQVPLGALCVCALGVAASAQVFNLGDVNSTVRIDTQTQAGMDLWNIDGVDHMAQEWYWFRAGNTPERSVDTVPQVGAFAVDTNPFVDPRPDTLNVQYRQPGAYQIELAYSLAGGALGSGRSSIMEAVRITNLGNAPLDLSFFQYGNLDLGGSAQDASVRFVDGNNVQQSDSGSSSVYDGIYTPRPTLVQAALFPSILNLLNDGNPSSLSGFPGPLGPGDLTYGVQWNLSLAPGGSFQVSAPRAIVPEPASVVLLVGLMGLAMIKTPGRRRSRP